MQDACERLDDLAREAVLRSRAVVTGTDPGGRATATFTGGELTGLAVDHRWAVAGGAAAITRGYTAIKETDEEPLTRRWPFPDLQRITGDRPPC